MFHLHRANVDYHPCGGRPAVPAQRDDGVCPRRAHHDGGGIRLDGVIDVVATVAALAIVYVLATWFLRYRDIRTNGGESAAGGHPAPERERPG